MCFCTILLNNINKFYVNLHTKEYYCRSECVPLVSVLQKNIFFLRVFLVVEIVIKELIIFSV